MRKSYNDPKVKKTLIRNYEQKIPADKKTGAVSAGSGTSKEKSYSNRNELDHPTLCSSEVIAHYLTDVKKSAPPPLSAEDLRINKSEINSKITKKLNFHFNDRIYRDLVELNNADVINKKNKKDKKPKVLIKKDQEPIIEDFCQDVKEDDLLPNIPLIKHKFKPIRSTETGYLHKLVASFENL